MDILVKKVKSTELLEIRSKVLRNSSNYEFCKFVGDNMKSSIHIGVFNDKKIIGGVSLIKNNSNYKNLTNCYQLRGMCILKDFQKKGIGIKMLIEAESLCKNLNIENIWMNAREKAANLYLKLNYIDSKIHYEIAGIGLHYFLYKNLK